MNSPPRYGEATVACGNRREAVCPACSAVYKRDARQFVRAGLAGGKGIPETIATHPCVFVTLTAPSFGPVHSRRMRGKTILPCRPAATPAPAAARTAATSPAPPGTSRSTPGSVSRCARTATTTTSPCYSTPTRPTCGAASPIPAPPPGPPPRPHTEAAARAGPRPFRQGGRIPGTRRVVHFHAVICLDAPGQAYQPSPPAISVDLLGEAISQAAAAVRLAIPTGSGTVITLTFGAPQGTDVRPIRRDDIAGSGEPLNHQAVANYIAKYTTKTLLVPGLPSLRLRREADIEHLRCPAHYRRMITTAWQAGPRFRAWAHMLGYGGHFLTKSRLYSVTFGQLRAARADHHRANRPPDTGPDAWGRPLDETTVLVIGTAWTYAGMGHTTLATELATASAARAREHSDKPIPVGASVSTGP